MKPAEAGQEDWGEGGGFHIAFTLNSTLSSHWISQRVHFDLTFDLKGKGKASRAEREKGKHQGITFWAHSH